MSTPTSFWVIERYIGNRLHYWTAIQRVWTEDVEMATRLADNGSAQAVLYNICDGHGRIAEHSMMRKP